MPALADGAILDPVNTPYPALTQPVSVTIGGLAATVTYAGAAPGAIAGLTQINARMSATVAAGDAVPVEVRVGGVPSQAGVTLVVGN